MSLKQSVYYLVTMREKSLYPRAEGDKAFEVLVR
jgi:hypothetical protein